MFVGDFAPRLDDKGRLFLPAKFRPLLSEGVVITRGQERCLYVYPQSDFAKMVQSLRDQPASTPELRAYERMLGSSGGHEVPDRQGRITIPHKLREYAGLERDCVVIGAVTRVEIWDTAAWGAYEAEHEAQYAQGAGVNVPGAL